MVVYENKCKNNKLKKLTISLALSLVMLSSAISFNTFIAKASFEDTVLVAYKVDNCLYLGGDGPAYDQMYSMIRYMNGYTYTESKSNISTWYKELFLVATWQYNRTYHTY